MIRDAQIVPFAHQPVNDSECYYEFIANSYGRHLRVLWYGLSLFPRGVDAGKVSAEFKDRVLYVHLPKSEKPTPKQIEVKVA